VDLERLDLAAGRPSDVDQSGALPVRDGVRPGERADRAARRLRRRRVVGRHLGLDAADDPDGALPTGLTLSGGGVISGTPTTAGTVTFTLKALDSSTPTAGQATRTLRIVVNPAPSAAVWVGNGANSAVNAFPLTGNGNVLPAATLRGSLTALNGIGGLACDATGNLYVAGANSNAIEEFASGASERKAAPIRVLQGAATGLASPHGIAIDPSGRLYVINYAANDVTVARGLISVVSGTVKRPEVGGVPARARARPRCRARPKAPGRHRRAGLRYVSRLDVRAARGPSEAP
jgi:hypothetical protein